MLKNFDHKMRTIPEWRQLYPKLLTALVAGSKADAVHVITQMIGITSPQTVFPESPATTASPVDARATAEGKSAASKAPLDSDVPAALHRKLNLVVIDTAFADMFQDPTAPEGDEQASAKHALAQEAAAGELLELFTVCLGPEIKQQKARIANFLLSAIQQERDAVVKERGLSIVSTSASHNNKKKSDGNEAKNNNIDKSSSKRKSISSPNIAVSVTPPIDMDNPITATLLLQRIREELGALQEELGGRPALLRSVCRRKVFAGAVFGAEQEAEVTELTEALLEKQKTRPENLEKDLMRLRMTCRCAVENDLVNMNSSSSGNDDARKNTVKTLRFDLGLGDGFVSAIGLDDYFGEGDEEQEKMMATADEIGQRVVKRLNNSSSNPKSGESTDDGFVEYPILPFALTMRCRIL